MIYTRSQFAQPPIRQSTVKQSASETRLSQRGGSWSLTMKTRLNKKENRAS